MKYLLAAGALALGTVVYAQQPSAGPQYTSAGELIRPADFREWVFVTSGLGMTYNQPAPQPASGQPAPARTPNFTNVYVNPSSYRAFMKTGRSRRNWDTAVMRKCVSITVLGAWPIARSRFM